MQDLDKRVHFLISIIEREGRTDSAFETEMALRRHRAVVAGSDSDTVIVEVVRDVFGRNAGYDKRQYACLVCRSTDWSQPRNRRKTGWRDRLYRGNKTPVIFIICAKGELFSGTGKKHF